MKQKQRNYSSPVFERKLQQRTLQKGKKKSLQRLETHDHKLGIMNSSQWDLELEDPFPLHWQALQPSQCRELDAHPRLQEDEMVFEKFRELHLYG